MPGKWIQEAVKRRGALRSKAAKAGGLTAKGTIKKSYLEKASRGKDALTRKQAALAMTLAKLNGRRSR